MHCYKESARAKGYSLAEFAGKTAEHTKYCNSNPDNEVWFWKGLFAGEKGELSTAAILFEHFLKSDDISIFSARAYYDVARAKMAIGLYAEAKKAIQKSKVISPCKPIIELAEELN